MQALIGYLVAIAVFLGGGYAGVQWLTAPEDLPSAVAIKRSTDPIRSTRAKLLARKKHEAAAEREANARPADADAGSKLEAAITAPDSRRGEDVAAQKNEENEAVAGRESSPSAAPSDEAGPADIRTAMASTPDGATPASAVVTSAVQQTAASPASSPSEVTADTTASSSTVALGADTGALSETPTRALKTPPATERQTRQAALRSLSPAEKQVIKSALARDAAAAVDRKRSAAKKLREAARFASALRKPVLMILRTIEYPDGRREQRLLPMSRARQAYAYAD